MAEYRLLTIWRIEAPLEAVYAAIHNSPHWPEWWPGMQKVEEITAGDANGINSVLRYVWQGQLPYQMVFEVRATRIEKCVAIEGPSRVISRGSAAGISSVRARSVSSVRVACPQHRGG